MGRIKSKDHSLDQTIYSSSSQTTNDKGKFAEKNVRDAKGKSARKYVATQDATMDKSESVVTDFKSNRSKKPTSAKTTVNLKQVGVKKIVPTEAAKVHQLKSHIKPESVSTSSRPSQLSQMPNVAIPVSEKRSKIETLPEVLSKTRGILKQQPKDVQKVLARYDQQFQEKTKPGITLEDVVKAEEEFSEFDKAFFKKIRETEGLEETDVCILYKIVKGVVQGILPPEVGEMLGTDSKGLIEDCRRGYNKTFDLVRMPTKDGRPIKEMINELEEKSHEFKIAIEKFDDKFFKMTGERMLSLAEAGELYQIAIGEKDGKLPIDFKEIVDEFRAKYIKNRIVTEGYFVPTAMTVPKGSSAEEMDVIIERLKKNGSEAFKEKLKKFDVEFFKKTKELGMTAKEAIVLYKIARGEGGDALKKEPFGENYRSLPLLFKDMVEEFRAKYNKELQHALTKDYSVTEAIFIPTGSSAEDMQKLLLRLEDEEPEFKKLLSKFRNDFFTKSTALGMKIDVDKMLYEIAKNESNVSLPLVLVDLVDEFIKELSKMLETKREFSVTAKINIAPGISLSDIEKAIESPEEVTISPAQKLIGSEEKRARLANILLKYENAFFEKTGKLKMDLGEAGSLFKKTKEENYVQVPFVLLDVVEDFRKELYKELKS